MSIDFPKLSDFRINPDSPDLGAAMLDGKMVPCNPNSNQDLYEKALDIAKAIRVSGIETRGTVHVKNTHYRVERMPNQVFAIRRVDDQVPTLQELGVNPGVRQLLLDENLGSIGGVVLIVGKPGRGKSYTATATLRDRLMTGVADYGLTYENPPEFILQGWHGEGYIDQNSIPEGQYHTHLSHSLRCFPAKGKSILFAGELLDSDSATAFSKIGLTGVLCISTAHGEDIINGVERWLSLMGAETSPGIRSVVANSLRLVIYQDLIRGHDGSYSPHIEALRVNDAAKNHIRNGATHLLATEIANTSRKLYQESMRGQP